MLLLLLLLLLLMMIVRVGGSIEKDGQTGAAKGVTSGQMAGVVKRCLCLIVIHSRECVCLFVVVDC